MRKLFAAGPEALRVCFVSRQYPPSIGGGIGRFTADLARGFAEAGHAVHVVSCDGEGERSVAAEDGVRVHRLPELRPEARELGPARADLARLALVHREVTAIHEAAGLDLVSSPLWLGEGLLLAGDPRFASVLTLHTSTKTLVEMDAYWRGSPRGPVLTMLERLAVAAHRHTHANSQAALARVEAEYGPPRGAFLIPHGVGDHAARVSRRRDADGRVRVLVVGRQEIRKGADLLLEAIPVLLQRFAALEFALLGPAIQISELGGRTLAEALRERLAASPEMSRRVHFAGPVSDERLQQGYADADILLFPSRYESFGLPVVEAMSFGLPVVACRAGGLPEIVVEGETGLLCPPGDVRGLVEAAGVLIADPERRRRFGAAARRRYLAEFSLVVSVPRTIAAYAAVAAAERLRRGALRLSAEDLDPAPRLATVLEQTTRCRGAAAASAAGALLAAAAEARRPRSSSAPTARPGTRTMVRLAQGFLARRLTRGGPRQAAGPERTAIVWLTHFLDPEAEIAFRRLVAEAAPFGRVLRARHDAAAAAETAGADVLIGDADLQAALPSRARERGERRAPLNDFLDLLHLAVIRRLPGFEDYWFIEYDVDFSGPWDRFFAAFRGCGADLLGTTLYPRSLNPDWYFWPKFAAPPAVAPAAQVRGFFPVARLSRRFAEAYAAEVPNGWAGHFEALYPTIAARCRLCVEDIGGVGPLVPPARRGRFYANVFDDLHLAPGGFQFLPAVSDRYFVPGAAEFAEADRLWHPIKTAAWRALAAGAGGQSQRLVKAN